MQDLEPFFGWRDHYTADQDELSPFYQREYNEFQYSQKVYNYYIHPQWDEFGSPTLYAKILFADYNKHFAIIELIGEWNDCITNDIMHLKRNLIEQLLENGISKFVIICENVLNFHGDDDSYYQEWYEEVCEERGWICFLSTLHHVEQEMVQTTLQNYVMFGPVYNNIPWRTLKPKFIVTAIEDLQNSAPKVLYY